MNAGGPPPRAGFLRDPGWSDATRAGLEALITHPPHPGPLAAFDFDDTVIDGDLSLTLLAAMDPSGAAREAYEADCAVDVRSGYTTLVETLIVGHTELEVRDRTAQALSDALERGSIRFRPAVRELIWALQRHRWQVYFVTASPAVVISVAAQQVGISAHNVLGMWCDTGPDGRFVAPCREPITYRHGKVEALRTRTDAALTFAAGDALTDLELLQEAHAALVFDKGNERLRAEARAHGWWIEEGL